MTLTSQVLITSQLENTLLALESLRQDEHIIEILSPTLAANLQSKVEGEMMDSHIHRIVTDKETFTVSDAKVVIEKAYMASETQTIIVLVATEFSPLIQNKLLKVIEEPPKNKTFILITQSKATILDTIRSRLPIRIRDEVKEEEALGLVLAQLSLATVYEFIQTHKRTDGKKMKIIVEAIAKEAIHSQKFNLDEKTLTLFAQTIKALDMGSPPTFVLNTLLLKLLARKKR
ncbi:MAG: DNA polymerase III subunit delta' [Sulfurovum sp.]|nr:DNA polymerase III subunit delta' [Sulfurovum sp.]